MCVAAWTEVARNRESQRQVPWPVQYDTVRWFGRRSQEMFRHPWGRALLGCFMTFTALGASAASLRPQRVPEICGSFVTRTPLDTARSTVKRAIEDGTRELNIFVRGLARKRLHKLNRVVEDIRIALVQDQLAVSFEGETYMTPANGASVPIDTLDGAPVWLSQTVSDDRVEQHFTTKRGELRRVFVLNGDELVMQVTMSSKHLRRPIQYSLLYAEKPGAGELDAAR